jgi:UDP-N-acetylglucosamine 1-carboxyvinyltransferase
MIVIEGGARLEGQVEVSGSKNAAIPILAATLLARGETVLEGIPRLRDIDSMIRLLQHLGAEVEHDGADLRIRVPDDGPDVAPYEIVSTMRGSFCVLGPLLARRGRAIVSYPGGCVLGLRPIDIHLKGLTRLGADVTQNHGYVCAESRSLRGSEMYLGGPAGSSVLGTANVLMAATLARGTTIIECAAMEPEVQDLARFLVAMGARIEGIGSPRLRIDGVDELQGARYRVIPDRIEAGTYLVAGALAGGSVLVKGARPDHLGAVIDKLQDMGIGLQITPEGILVKGGILEQGRTVLPGEVTTLTYPGFPTDLQAQLSVLFALASGISIVTERIYPDRFMHAGELNRLGARIRKDGASVIVQGVEALHGAPVMASDLRASAALVLAGLVARGTTEVRRVYHIDRGYERIERKLAGLGARIFRVDQDDTASATVHPTADRGWVDDDSAAAYIDKGAVGGGGGDGRRLP